MYSQPYSHASEQNQRPNLLLSIIGTVIKWGLWFPRVTLAWGILTFGALGAYAEHALIVGLVTVLLLVVLVYGSTTSQHWLRNRWAAFLPLLAEARFLSCRLGRRRGRKALSYVWPRVEVEDHSVPMFSTRDGYVWHIEGHRLIGDIENAEQAISDALGVFERDFGVHFFTIEPKRGQRQQYLVRFYYEEPADPLAEPTAFEDLAGMPVSDGPGCVVLGPTSDGHHLNFQVLGKQTLIVGTSGSGKAAVIWSIIAGLSDRIAEGTVLLYGIDLKGGVEFTQGSHLFRKIVHDPSEVECLLDELNQLQCERLDHMRREGVRAHHATTEHPAVLLVIDEAAALSYMYEAKQAKKIEGLLKTITTQGRAAGFSTLAAVQDPRKEAFSARDTFTQTVALRFRTAADARIAIGTSAYEEGAHCDQIPEDQPGVGYVITSKESAGESSGVVRFRAFYASDLYLRSLPAAAVRPEGGGVDDV